MVDPVGRREENIVMTVFTGVGCLNVGCVFADGVAAVVATETIAGDVYVIEIGGYPGTRRMAVIAVVTTGYVSRLLSGRYHAGMTG